MSADAIRRRLTTILAADVVGYSQLMSVDEEGTVRVLDAYREIIQDLVSKHGGRIFNTAGDAVFVEFTSAVEAVRCAISIQEELAVHNAETRPRPKLLTDRSLKEPDQNPRRRSRNGGGIALRSG